MRIKLIPLTQRAKNRVREHGDIYHVVQTEKVQCFNGKRAHLLQAEKDCWRGWFACDEEVFEKTSQSNVPF